jgi:hypothetical protein
MPKTVRVLSDVSIDAVPFDALFAGNEPVILKGLAAQWPMVLAGQKSAQALIDMLIKHYDEKPVLVYEGVPEMRGRYTYNETVSGFNFDSVRRDLSEILHKIKSLPETDHPYYYMNSITFDQTFSGLDKANTLTFNHPEFETYPRISKIWIGNQSRASAHYDMPKNIACCVYGKRRFTLFPPTQTPNLYPGPLFPTPGGQVVTMADLQDPDFERFPKIREALEEAVIADLEPGDVLYYPSMWWHEVEAFDPFNVMVNYWWSPSPNYMGNPMDALMHAMLNIRDRPDADKRAWRELFDYYVFGDVDIPRRHLPEDVHGALAEMDLGNARRIRAAVHQSLKR